MWITTCRTNGVNISGWPRRLVDDGVSVTEAARTLKIGRSTAYEALAQRREGVSPIVERAARAGRWTRRVNRILVIQDVYDVRMPTSPGTGRPMLRCGPFAVLAGILLVGNATLFAVAGDFGVFAVPAAVLAAGPVVLAWYRPVAAWVVMAMAGPLITGIGVALASPMTPLPWYFNLVFAQLPVMYVLALPATRRVTVIACVVTIAVGTADREVARGAHLHQTEAARPGAGGGFRLRERPGGGRRSLSGGTARPATALLRGIRRPASPSYRRPHDQIDSRGCAAAGRSDGLPQ